MRRRLDGSNLHGSPERWLSGVTTGFNLQSFMELIGLARDRAILAMLIFTGVNESGRAALATSLEVNAQKFLAAIARLYLTAINKLPAGVAPIEEGEAFALMDEKRVQFVAAIIEWARGHRGLDGAFMRWVRSD